MFIPYHSFIIVGSLLKFANHFVPKKPVENHGCNRAMGQDEISMRGAHLTLNIHLPCKESLFCLLELRIKKMSFYFLTLQHYKKNYVVGNAG